MMVAGKGAFTGSIVDPDQIKEEKKRSRESREAIAGLNTCGEEKNLEPVMYVLLDSHASLENKKKAAGLLTVIDNLDCIEPLRNHEFKDPYLEQIVNMAISAIMSSHFVKECPYCAELIKVRATVCKHCQKELV